MQHLAGALRRFEILAAVVSQPEVQTLSGCRLLDDVCVAFELVADGRPDEIGTVGIEPLLHHQIDVTEVDVAKVDRDLLGFRGPGSQFTYIAGHGNIPFAIQLDGNQDGIWMFIRGFQGPTDTRISTGASPASKFGRLDAPSVARTEKNSVGEGGSHENGYGGMAAANFAPALTRAPRDGLVRRTGLAAALGSVPDDQMLPAK